MNNLANLRSALRSWTHRESDTLTDALIDSFVELVDAKLRDELRTLRLEQTGSLSLTSGTAIIQLPTGYLGLVSLFYDDGGGDLDAAPRHDVDRMYSESEAGRPRYFAIVDDDIIFDRDADQTFALTIRYFGELDLVSTTTNWLTENRPNIYFYGCMAEAHKWLEDWDNAQRYEGMFNSEVERLKLGDHMARPRAKLRVDPALVRRGTFNIDTGE